MSILIKDMEMPKNCDKCKFSWWDVGHLYCEADGKPWGLEVTEYANGKHPNCPIIEVPEDVQPMKHGKNLNEEWHSLFECSICHWSCWDTYCGDTDTYNYCPNCGARMDGKE